MIFLYPTDTAYAIGCDSTDEKSVKKIFEIKKRSKTKPLPLIASSFGMVKKWCEISGVALKIAKENWPGPITLVLKLKDSANKKINSSRLRKISKLASKNGFVAIRVPSCDKARSLCRSLGAPIVSTSANLSGTENCYSVKSAISSLGERSSFVDKIIDSGKLTKKPSSTIISFKKDKIKILRQGGIDVSKYAKTKQKISANS